MSVSQFVSQTLGAVISALQAKFPVQTADLGNLQVTTAKIAANAVTKRTNGPASMLQIGITSATYVTQQTISITSGGGEFKLFGHLRGNHSVGGSECYVAYRVDGGPDLIIVQWSEPSAGYTVSGSFAEYIGVLSAGAHTVDIRVKTSASTMNIITGSIPFVEETLK